MIYLCTWIAWLLIGYIPVLIDPQDGLFYTVNIMCSVFLVLSYGVINKCFPVNTHSNTMSLILISLTTVFGVFTTVCHFDYLNNNIIGESYTYYADAINILELSTLCCFTGIGVFNGMGHRNISINPFYYLRRLFSGSSLQKNQIYIREV